jgi:putative transposase
VYLSIRYTERLAAAGVEPSVGSVGDSYDNALAESVIGLYKTEVIGPQGPWRHAEQVEFATLTWIDWFNNRRLLESGTFPQRSTKRPTTANKRLRPWRPDSCNRVSGELGAVHSDSALLPLNVHTSAAGR